jgi:hypothetical protein
MFRDHGLLSNAGYVDAGEQISMKRTQGTAAQKTSGSRKAHAPTPLPIAATNVTTPTIMSPLLEVGAH